MVVVVELVVVEVDEVLAGEELVDVGGTVDVELAAVVDVVARVDEEDDTVVVVTASIGSQVHTEVHCWPS